MTVLSNALPVESAFQFTAVHSPPQSRLDTDIYTNPSQELYNVALKLPCIFVP